MASDPATQRIGRLGLAGELDAGVVYADMVSGSP